MNAEKLWLTSCTTIAMGDSGPSAGATSAGEAALNTDLAQAHVPRQLMRPHV